MGAKAGYQINGIIDEDLIKINNFKVINSSIVTEDLGNGQFQDYHVIQIKCDIDCEVEDINYTSPPNYIETLYGLTKIKITEMSLIPKYEDLEDESVLDEDRICQTLVDLKFNSPIIEPYSKFTGSLICDINNLEEQEYAIFYVNDINMHISNKEAVTAIDEYIHDTNYRDDFYVCRIDGRFLKMFDSIDSNLDAAIAWAERNNGYNIKSCRTWFVYAISNDGHIYVDDQYPEGVEVVWENPNYIEEDF